MEKASLTSSISVKRVENNPEPYTFVQYASWVFVVISSLAIQSLLIKLTTWYRRRVPGNLRCE